MYYALFFLATSKYLMAVEHMTRPDSISKSSDKYLGWKTFDGGYPQYFSYYLWEDSLRMTATFRPFLTPYPHPMKTAP